MVFTRYAPRSTRAACSLRAFDDCASATSAPDPNPNSTTNSTLIVVFIISVSLLMKTNVDALPTSET
jgi:hypothetical protein